MPYTLYTTHTDKRGPSFFQALQNCICIASITLLMLEVSTPAFSPNLFAEEIAQTLGKMWNCSFIFHKSQVHCPLEVLTSFQAIYSTSMCEGLSCSPRYRSCLFKSFFKKSRIFLASPTLLIFLWLWFYALWQMLIYWSTQERLYITITSFNVQTTELLLCISWDSCECHTIRSVSEL